MVQRPLESSDAATARTLKTGTRVADRFRLGELLQESSDQIVFEAIDEQNGFEVLMRFRSQPTLPDPHLRDAGVPQYVDQGCIGTWFGSVLDLGAGQPLADALQALDSDAVPLPELVTLGVDLLSTLDRLHPHGRTHGNLGIHDLHLTPEWGLKIIDWPEQVEPLMAAAQPFASPERQEDQRGDPRSDLYAVAGLIYTLATGQPPFGLSASLSRQGHLHHDLAPHELLPEALYSFLYDAMQKDPDDRFQTASAMSEALLDAWEDCNPTVEGESDPVSEEFETLGPPPVRLAEPVWTEEEPDRPSMLLPVILIGLLCITVAALAGGAFVVAGGMWALTAYAPQSFEVAVAEPELTMPDAAPPVADTPSAEAVLALAGAAVETPATEPVEDTRPPGLAGEAVRVPVSFDYDSWQARPEADWDGFLSDAGTHPGPIRLTGHTDDRGTPEANRLMGLGRAWSVSVLMAAGGITEGRIEVESAGEAHPIAPNDSASGRAANRRVTAEFQGEAPRLQDLLVPVE